MRKQVYKEKLGAFFFLYAHLHPENSIKLDLEALLSWYNFATLLNKIISTNLISLSGKGLQIKVL